LWTYIAADNEAAANRMLTRLFNSFRTLSQAPFAGKSYPHLAPELRGFPCRPNVIFYRSSPDIVVIFRVLHGARNLPALFPG
jgi:toxin ParE1/3/4